MLSRLWSAFVAIVILVITAWSVMALLAPASWWLVVRSVSIADTSVGVPAIMTVDRSIYRDFSGSYTVDVERLLPSGKYAAVCSAQNATNYRVDAEYPTPLTLDWWTWPVECDLSAGDYRVETVWKITPDVLPNKTVSSMSNTFTVLP